MSDQPTEILNSSDEGYLTWPQPFRTVEQLQAQIASLIAEIKRLQDQLNQPPMWGENHCGAKLTDADVLAIRARYKRYDRLHGTPAIAREYGMSNSAIGAVVRGHAWKHLPLTAQPKEGEG